MITEINAAVGGIIPSSFWDISQFIIGTLCFVLLFIERRFNKRYLTYVRKSADPIKRFFVWCGQLSVGLAGALSIAIVVDVITPPESPPRTVIVAFMVMLCLRQLSTCYAAYERAIEDGALPPGLWPLIVGSFAKR